jgi:hypothetical protein
MALCVQGQLQADDRSVHLLGEGLHDPGEAFDARDHEQSPLVLDFGVSLNWYRGQACTLGVSHHAQQVLQSGDQPSVVL